MNNIYMDRSNLEKKEVDAVLKQKLKAYVYDILGCCIDVRKELGCWLNEYMYQEALSIALTHKEIPFIKEYRFSTIFQGVKLQHCHQVDFFIKGNVFLECKAVAALITEQRQQLWNYLRLAKVPIGILYNFAPSRDQCEKYYYDIKTGDMRLF